jgi:ATP-binding protein involved in chromosome partitioning
MAHKLRGVGKTIVIASGKGGVGKSSVAANIAASLATKGFKVGVLDADIYGPSMAYLFNSFAKPDTNERGQIIPVDAGGIKLVSIGMLVDDKSALVWRGPMASKALYQMMGANWEGLDYLIIDTPPGTGDVHLSLIQNYHIDGVVLVATPQKLAILDVVKSKAMFEKLSVPIIGLVVNMAGSIFGKYDGSLGVTVLGEVPLDSNISNSHDNKQLAYNTSALIKEVFDNIANKI